MRSCCHCGASQSPCWRRGPPEKPLLCNACGAHYLVKKSLDNYMPGQRTSSATTSSNNSQHTAQQQQQLMHRQRHRLQEEAAGRAASTASGGSSVEQECLEVDQPPAVSSKKRSRLVSCSVHEVEPFTNSALRCKRTFETADGCVVTVVRRVRKQLKPRASCST